MLLALDDVNHRTQLPALVGEVSWFGPRSRINITTRDERILKVHHVHDNHIYKPEELDKNQSLQLFSMHAFEAEKEPPEQFMELSRNMARYAGGLPLTLEVFSSSLCNEGEEEVWKSTLQKLKAVPPTEVYEKLKISYDRIDANKKKHIS